MSRIVAFRSRKSGPAGRAFGLALERYAAVGVDVEQALARLGSVSLSLQCWQGDDVSGFDGSLGVPGGGLAVTGAYPGRAATPGQLRQDLELALKLIPGVHRVNLHAMYGEFGGRRVDRDAVEPAHFSGWVDWARALGLGLDFNPTCFGHPKAASGFTLSHVDAGIRRFWVEHCQRSRRVGVAMGRALGTPCVTNLWIPDGMKDTPADRRGPRERLEQSLDAVFREKIDPRHGVDAVEGKLFGIGSESYTVGSHDFYLGYAASRGVWLCLDSGHFHPTEAVADKVTAVLPFVPGILLHVSRGVRWDSDHVVTMTDELQAMMREVVVGAGLQRVRLGMDYFDASINRVAAWVIGARAVLRAVLVALLEPPGVLEAERSGDMTGRLVMQEEAKGLPHGAVWDGWCERSGVPVGGAWLDAVRAYERREFANR